MDGLVPEAAGTNTDRQQLRATAVDSVIVAEILWASLGYGMTSRRFDSGRDLPRPFIALGSAFVVVHCLAVLMAALAQPSGPWHTPLGADLAEPPYFTGTTAGVTTAHYLGPLRLADHGGNVDNVPQAGVALEVRLKDDEGHVTRVIRLPDENANAFVRRRQTLFLRGLAPDLPVLPRPGEMIPAPGQEPARIPIWETDGDRRLRLEWKPEHLIPRSRDVWRPSDDSLIRVRSLARYYCRQQGAASAEVIRTTREPIRPEPVLLLSEVPALDKLTASYGEFTP